MTLIARFDQYKCWRDYTLYEMITCMAIYYRVQVKNEDGVYATENIVNQVPALYRNLILFLLANEGIARFPTVDYESSEAIASFWDQEEIYEAPLTD